MGGEIDQDVVSGKHDGTDLPQSRRGYMERSAGHTRFPHPMVRMMGGRVCWFRFIGEIILLFVGNVKDAPRLSESVTLSNSTAFSIVGDFVKKYLY
jgi:hypothetical protein